MEVFEELIIQAQTGLDKLIQVKNLSEFFSSLGYLLTNTLNNEVQKNCLKFLQIYFKSLDKFKTTQQTTNKSNNNNSAIKYAKTADEKINVSLLEYLIECSVSLKIQLKQLSIDLIYSYMKLTDDLNACFGQFVKYGIEASNLDASKNFLDSTLHILITEEFATRDFTPLIRALLKQPQVNPMCEAGAYRCLNKIESVVKKEKFNAYLSKLPQNLKATYLNKRGFLYLSFKE